MSAEKGILAVECVATGMHEALVAEFESPMGGVEMGCEWTGEDFNKVVLATPSGKLLVVVTSVVGEGDADVRVVVLDPATFGVEGSFRGVHAREVGRVARAVAAIRGVDDVWPDAAWPSTFLVSVRPEADES